ncbi:MAG: sigma 54-interacting transcriptional regulator [candidate division Zixibacteria bacterium]
MNENDKQQSGCRPMMSVVTENSRLGSEIAGALREGGFSSTIVTNLFELSEKNIPGGFDLIILAPSGPIEGLADLVSETRRLFVNAQIFCLADSVPAELVIDVLRRGAYDLLETSCDFDVLMAKVHQAMQQVQKHRELFSLREHVAMNYGFDNLIGFSSKMVALKESATKIAPTDITVLITGPKGSGKELLAQTIHHHSVRRSSRMATIDFSSIPPEKQAHELFANHSNGDSLLTKADGGTLLLEEIWAMSETVQSQLSLFLRDQRLQGSTAHTSPKLDIRVIATSSRDMNRLVAESAFSAELLALLNVIELSVPPLIKRPEDIELLIEYMLRRNSTEQPITITPDAVDLLLKYHWPGNVGELENSLKRAAALCLDGKIDAKDIVFLNSSHASETTPVENQNRKLTIKGRLLDDTQRSLIVKALSDNDWNFTRTAAELGIGRTTLWRKIRTYELKQEDVTV